MSFGLSPAMPFADFTGVVPAWWLNFVRSSLADALDPVGGGVYAILPGHTIDFSAGGGDITIEAPLTFTDGDIPVGGHLDVEGTVRINSGGTLDVKSGGIAYVRSGGGIDVKSGGQITVEIGGLIGLAGEMLVSDLGGGGTNGTILLGSFLGLGHLIVSAAGDITVQNGGAVAVQAGGAVNVAGTTAHPTIITLTGDDTLPTNCSLVLTHASGLSLSANSPASFLGMVALAGATTQTGAYTRSGTGAYTKLRVIQIAAGATATINGADADIFDLPATLTAPMTITIATNATAAHHRFVIRQTSNTPGFTTTIQNAGGTRLIGQFYDSGGLALSAEYQGAIEYYYSAAGAPTVLFVNTGIEGVGHGVVLLASVN